MFYKSVLEKTRWKFPFEIAELGEKQHFSSALSLRNGVLEKNGVLGGLHFNLRTSESASPEHAKGWADGSAKISR